MQRRDQPKGDKQGKRKSAHERLAWAMRVSECGPAQAEEEEEESDRLVQALPGGKARKSVVDPWDV